MANRASGECGSRYAGWWKRSPYIRSALICCATTPILSRRIFVRLWPSPGPVSKTQRSKPALPDAPEFLRCTCFSIKVFREMPLVFFTSAALSACMWARSKWLVRERCGDSGGRPPVRSGNRNSGCGFSLAACFLRERGPSVIGVRIEGLDAERLVALIGRAVLKHSGGTGCRLSDYDQARTRRPPAGYLSVPERSNSCRDSLRQWSKHFSIWIIADPCGRVFRRMAVTPDNDKVAEPAYNAASR